MLREVQGVASEQLVGIRQRKIEVGLNCSAIEAKPDLLKSPYGQFQQRLSSEAQPDKSDYPKRIRDHIGGNNLDNDFRPALSPPLFRPLENAIGSAVRVVWL